MNLKLIKVEALPDYFLWLEYNNGEIRKLDIKPYLDFGVFSELKNIEVFQTVHISFDTVQWDNDLDIDPEFIYNHSIILEDETMRRA